MANQRDRQLSVISVMIKYWKTSGVVSTGEIKFTNEIDTGTPQRTAVRLENLHSSHGTRCAATAAWSTLVPPAPAVLTPLMYAAGILKINT